MFNPSVFASICPSLSLSVCQSGCSSWTQTELRLLHLLRSSAPGDRCRPLSHPFPLLPSHHSFAFASKTTCFYCHCDSGRPRWPGWRRSGIKSEVSCGSLLLAAKAKLTLARRFAAHRFQQERYPRNKELFPFYFVAHGHFHLPPQLLSVVAAASASREIQVAMLRAKQSRSSLQVFITYVRCVWWR